MWWNLSLNSPARYPLAHGNSSILSWFGLIRLLLDECKTAGKADGTGFCRPGVIAQVAAELI
jgi:hypothetical protein